MTKSNLQQVLSLFNSSVRSEVYNAILMYLFRGITSVELTRVMRKYVPKIDTRTTLRTITSSGEITLDLKAKVLYSVANNKPMKRNLAPATIAHIQKLLEKYHPLTRKEFLEQISFASNRTNRWLKRKVYEKLRFIANSQNLSLSDLESDLRLMGVRALMLSYPCIDSSLHAANLMQRTMANQLVNLIKRFTTVKRARIIKDEDGEYTSLTVTLDEAKLNTKAAAEVSDLTLEVRKLVNSLKGKRKTLIELLCGAYSKPFTAWLQERRFRIETNEELLDKLPTSEYISLISEYLHLAKAKAFAFIESIKERLKIYCAVSHFS